MKLVFSTLSKCTVNHQHASRIVELKHPRLDKIVFWLGQSLIYWCMFYFKWCLTLYLNGLSPHWAVNYLLVKYENVLILHIMLKKLYNCWNSVDMDRFLKNKKKKKKEKQYFFLTRAELLPETESNFFHRNRGFSFSYYLQCCSVFEK